MNPYQRLVARGWWLMLLVFLAGAAVSGGYLPGFGIEAGTDALLNEDDPDLAYYNQTRADWESDEYVIICAHRKAGWFDREGIALIDELAARVKLMPYVKSVLSLTTVPLLKNRGARPTANIMELRAGMTTLNHPAVDLEKAKAELLTHTQALGNLISDGTERSPAGLDTSILAFLEIPEEVVKYEPERNRLLSQPPTPESQRRFAEIDPAYQRGKKELQRRREQLVFYVRALARDYEGKLDEPLRFSGLPIININLVEHVRHDVALFGVLSFAVFALALLLIYRRPRWTALPVVACVLPVTFIVALMVGFDKKVTVVTSNLPVLLFVLMLPYAVYYIERYRELRALHPEQDPRWTSVAAPVQIWVPCLYSCTTTMAGVASLMTSGINPVRTFGLMMTIGLGVGLATIMFFLPAAHVPLPGVRVARAGASSGPQGPLKALVGLCLRAPAAVVGLSLAVLGVAVYGTTRLKVETKFIDYFWEKSEIYQGLDYIDKRMGGTTPFEIILTAREPGYFKKPEGLAALGAVERFFRTVSEKGEVTWNVPETGNVRSLKTLIDEVRESFAAKEASHVVNLINLVAPGQLREFCDKDFRISRVLVRMKETDPNLNRNRILASLKRHIAEQPELRGLEVRPTGIFLLYANMLNSLIESQKDTFVLVVAVIWAMLVLCFLPGEWRGALSAGRGALGGLLGGGARALALSVVVLLPQLLPVFVVLGCMGFLGIALDPVTVMIASIAMGVGIDAAIQYTVRYRIELKETGGNIAESVRRAHATIGRAILIATSIIFAGFLILVLSEFRPTVYFGLFTGLAMLMGLLASLTTLPAMFVLLRFPRLR